MKTLSEVVEIISAARARVAKGRAVLVAISGIDGCGKGYVTKRLGERVEQRGWRVASFNVDGWLNLPAVRFSPTDPAGNFYRNAIRFDAMFAQLVEPLRATRTVRVEADFAEETATSFRKHVYEFTDVDVILLEGIYLLKKEYAAKYDVSLWIECTFETALERALARAQEGLSAEATTRAYRTIYFPAQEIHFARDNPKAAATAVVANDARAGGVVG